MVPIYGAEKIARMFIGLARKAANKVEMRPVRVNGQPGILTLYRGELAHVLTLDIVDGRIENCFVFRNPDKLAHMTKADFGLLD